MYNVDGIFYGLSDLVDDQYQIRSHGMTESLDRQDGEIEEYKKNLKWGQRYIQLLEDAKVSKVSNPPSRSITLKRKYITDSGSGIHLTADRSAFIGPLEELEHGNAITLGTAIKSDEEL